jgi:hypothetical protein
MRVFIGVQGGVTDLVKSVIRHVVADQPSHAAGRPRGPASTEFWLRIPYYCLLESVTMKPPHVRATPWAHWLAAFAHYLLMLGTFLG